MITTIENEWITLAQQRNEVTIQRKFAGLETRIKLNNVVDYCHLFYWEQELYPNATVIKCEEKYYSLEDLAYTEITIDGILYSMPSLAVLTGFITSLGKPYIIDPCRGTLIDLLKLPLDSPSGLPLHLNTRTKTVK